MERTFAIRSSGGGERFRVRHNGRPVPGHDLIATDEAPLLVVAVAEDTGEEIVLFDGGRHGYDAMFCEEFDSDALDARSADQTYTADGHDIFGLEFGVNDNIDWDDEEAEFADDDGRIQLNSGAVIDGEQLRADGFDALGLIGIADDGARFEILSEELA